MWVRRCVWGHGKFNQVAAMGGAVIVAAKEAIWQGFKSTESSTVGTMKPDDTRQS
jgi:hypothetical protein